MRFLVYLRLLSNFGIGLVLSGWDTARIILRGNHNLASGLVRLRYRGLSPAQAGLVGALITLAPGTSTVDIDPEAGIFILHLLDLERRDEILQGIQRDFIEPLQQLNGAAA